MRLRNLSSLALVITALMLTACSSPAPNSAENASSNEETSGVTEATAQADLLTELAAQGWNGPLDLDANHLDYGMGEVTIEGEIIPMVVTCAEIPYDPRPFAFDATLEGIDSAGRLLDVSVGRSFDVLPWDPHEFWPDIEGYDGHESGTLIVYRDGEGYRLEKFFQLSPGYGDPHAEALPGLKVTDDWRFSAIAASDEYADDPTDFVLPIEIIGRCQEDWIGPFALSKEEWDARS